MLREAGYYTRMALGVWKFMRTPRVSEPAAFIRWQLENREANFLSTVRRVIFANPDNCSSQKLRSFWNH